MLFSMQAPMMCRGNTAPLVYRSQASSAGGTTAITKPAGLQVGDLVLLVEQLYNTSIGNVTTSGGSVWASLGVGNAGIGAVNVFWKILTSVDVANGWSTAFSHSGMTALAYRGSGAALAQVAAADNANGAPAVLNLGSYGGTESKGAISVLFDRDSSKVATPPAGFTLRYIGTVTQVADALGTYEPGAPLVWTIAGTSTFGEAAVVYDVT